MRGGEGETRGLSSPGAKSTAGGHIEHRNRPQTRQNGDSDGREVMRGREHERMGEVSESQYLATRWM